MPRDKPSKANTRPDHSGPQRAQFESNKKKIYATQTRCGICGKPVDFRLKFPHPLSAEVSQEREIQDIKIRLTVHMWRA
ncbi:MAG: hypothetical protein MJ065_08520 [Oscillospiraceae bacterium]|nr:hypothetical protein [Oscillospiraceae bacterium]